MNNYKIIFTIIGIISFVVSRVQFVYAQNPFLPSTAFIADGEPRVFELNGEKRLFIYGSKDEAITDFCGYGYDVWSAPINDLTKWTNHGEAFHISQIQNLGYGKIDNQRLFAPDCVYNPVTNKYYLYVFMGLPYKLDGKEGPLLKDSRLKSSFENNGPSTFVAESDSPIGPFTNPVACDWPAGSKEGAFDPGVLVLPQNDDEVRVYVYWGFSKPNSRWAEVLSEDMHTIINGKKRRKDITSYYTTLNNPELNNHSIFYEASSIRQVAKEKFVFIYSAKERINALTYCYSNTPEGPWTYGGHIVDNGHNWYIGNNHGSIVDIDGQWYVVYHRKTDNDFNRQAMIEPIEVKIEGDKVIIPQVEMTSQGIQTNGLDAFKRYYAGTICYITRGSFVKGSERSPDGLNPVVITGKQPIIGWKYFNFGKEKLTNSDKLELSLNAKVLTLIKGSIQVSSPEDTEDVTKRITIANFEMKPELSQGGYKEITVPIKGLNDNESLNGIGGLKDKLAVFILFDSEDGELCHLKEIEFSKK